MARRYNILAIKEARAAKIARHPLIVAKSYQKESVREAGVAKLTLMWRRLKSPVKLVMRREVMMSTHQPPS